MIVPKEIYAKFRLSIDNGFKNQFSYVHYRRWGQMELWEGGRFTSAPPSSTTTARIEVWFNWKLVGTYMSYEDARGAVRKLLRQAPVSLHDLEQYLDL